MVSQVLMQLVVMPFCRFACILAAAACYAAGGKDGTLHVSRMVTQESRQWRFDRFVFAVVLTVCAIGRASVPLKFGLKYLTCPCLPQ